MKAKISKTTIDDLRAQAMAAKKTLYIWDTEFPGFGALSTAKGSASYFVEYRLGGRSAPNRRISIGKHGPLTPAEARTRAKMKLGKVADKVDVAAVEKAKRLQFSAGTLREFAERYLVAEDHGNRYWRETRRLIERNVYPALGSKPIVSVTKADITAVVDNARERSHAAARNVFSAVRPLFAWAHARGIVDSNPMTGMRGPEPLKSRDRVLTDDEIRAFWRATERLGGVFGPIFQLLLLTGQRRDEVGGMRWNEIDLDNATWTIAQERCKNGKAHHLDLSPQALQILKTLHGERLADSILVFTTTGETSVSGFSKTKAKLDQLMTAEYGKPLQPWRTHDLRRTAASGMAGLGFAPQVIERVLNHVSGAQGGLVGVYQRHEYKDDRKAAMLAWGDTIQKLTSRNAPSNMVKLARVAAAAE